MAQIGKYCKTITAALFLCSVTGWASYQPITGSTVVINQSGGGPIQTTLMNGATAYQTTAWSVNPGTGSYPISGSINNTGFNVNNTPSVVVSSVSNSALSDNGAAATTNRLGTVPGIYQNTYLNGTAATQGRNAALEVFTDGGLHVNNLPAMRPYSYHASTQTPSVSAATEIAVFGGNASSTTLVTGLRITCTETTAGQVTISVLKRSVADTAGTAVALTATPDDSNYGVARSTAIYAYTANPTTGTVVGILDMQSIGCMASATASPGDIMVENWKMKPIVLRTSNEQIVVNLANPATQVGTTVTGGLFQISWEWMELAPISP